MRTKLLLVAVLVVLSVWLAFPPSRTSHVRDPNRSRAEPPPPAEILAKKPATDKTTRPEPDSLDDPAEQRAKQLRLRMVSQQLRGRDITDQRVLEAMRRVPRHRFVPEVSLERAYADQPCPIGHGQTISQPYIVALMTQLARPKPTALALDVGTGSGYQAAVLAELVEHVYSIEIVPPLADQARGRLAAFGYKNVEVRQGDGYRGWPQHAPFDVIIVAAAPDHVPQPLIEQLAPGGRMVIPVGSFFQNLLLIEKQLDGSIRKRTVASVAFVPMTGEARDESKGKP